MLHALLDYARQEKRTAEPGFSPKTVHWLIEFSLAGRSPGLYDFTGGDPKSKGREFSKCPDLSQPELIGAGTGARHFLVDSLEVVALLTKDGQVDEKLQAKHAYFASLLEQASSSVAELATLAAALRDEATLEAIRVKLAEQKAKPTDKATLALTDSSGNLSILVERDDWHDWWRAFRSQLAVARSKKGSGKGRKQKADTAESKMLCLLSGELVEPLATHNKIEGLSNVGGRGPGDALISFDKEAFTSFGLAQGANAAMSETMVKTYVTALNHLIRYRSRRVAGVKVVYWYSGRVDAEDDPVRELLEGFGLPEIQEEESDQVAPNESRAAKVRQRAQAEGCARRLLEAIRSGDRPNLANFRYYALTLSVNPGRVVVRDWMEGRFEELVQAVNAWFDDLGILGLAGNQIAKAPRFESVVTSLLPERRRGQKYQDWVKPIGSPREVLWRCALGGRSAKFPETIARRVLIQHRASMVNGEFSSCLNRSDEHFALRRSRLYSRIGILKAFLVRSNFGDNAMLTYLNEDLDDPCYQFGRLVAVLADLQHGALRKESGESVKASIVDRFYATASTAPRLVHARLISLSNHHLRKLEQQDERGVRAANAIRDRIAEISMRIDPQRFPAIMPLAEQSLFALGYYHQIAQMNRDRRAAATRKRRDAEERTAEEA